MFGAITVLAGVGVVCASGVAISSAFRFFLTYEYDLTAKMKESKRNERTEMKRPQGGEGHERHIQDVSNRARARQ